MDQFVVNEVHTAFQLDSLPTTHPIVLPVNNPSDIRQMFDTISYKKGATIIRMMSHFLEESNLKAGLQKYLQTYQYGNAKHNDLWATLHDNSVSEGMLPENATIKTIMDTWTLKSGYPLVTVKRDRANGTALISQVR